MAKKYKRNVPSSASAKTAAPTEKTPAYTPGRRAAEFNPDYTYIINDLKRIGVLAGSFFVILIVLSFILN